MSLQAPERRFDLATAFGILFALGIVAAAILENGALAPYLDLASALLVLGGTLAVTTACFTLGDMLRATGLVGKTVVYPHYNALQTAESMLDLARHARKNNLLALQNNIAKGTLDAFMEKGMAMVVDNVAPDKVEQLLMQDIHSLAERHNKGVSIFRKAADIAPAMGLIGTLIGLVQMLGNLSDPSKLGPAMAIALLTTLYGALLAYVLFIPLATKLERNTDEELLVRHIQLEGILSIARQENPRKLEMALATILPPLKYHVSPKPLAKAS
ncbi:flagellar motor protein MotA [bacterium]|nr:flagellar motor protein MotA [bacterium]